MSCKPIIKPTYDLPKKEALDQIKVNLDLIVSQYKSKANDFISKFKNLTGIDLAPQIDMTSVNKNDTSEANETASKVQPSVATNPNTTKTTPSKTVKAITPKRDVSPGVASVTIKGKTATGEAKEVELKSASGVNSAWRVNFIVNKLGVENVDKIGTTSIPESEYGYKVKSDQPWGYHWKDCRPPGLHLSARRAAEWQAIKDPIRKFGDKNKKDQAWTIEEVLPIDRDLYFDAVTATTWQKSDGDREEFFECLYLIYKAETSERFSIPQQNFDFRPKEGEVEIPLYNHFDEGPFPRRKGDLVIDTPYRPKDKTIISVWGAYQYTVDTWQDDMEYMYPGLIRQNPSWAYPWFAPIKYENAARLWKAKDIWGEIRSLELPNSPFHMSQKAAVLYMFNHRPVIKNAFITRYVQIRTENANITDSMELFYITWEDKQDGKTSWLTSSTLETGKLGYKISSPLFNAGIAIKGLPPQFIHKQVT
jgi:hypothetical protein